MSDDETRQRGKEMMQSVYGFDIDPVRPYELDTVDQLFAEAWTAGDLSVRDRRLMLIGLMFGNGMADLVVMQMGIALDKGELAEDDLREIVRFMAYYAGWPRAGRVHMDLETMLDERSKGAAGATD